MSLELDVASRLAEEAGELISAALGKVERVDLKSPVDLVTEVDRAAQEIILRGLRDAFPDHAIVAEESEAVTRPAGPCWYVDPIDGTTNFVHGLPHCSVSIALHVDGLPEAAVVLDPCKRELFCAQRGAGATLNGDKIGVSSSPELGQSLFVTGFPYDRREYIQFYLSYFEAFILAARDLRRFGSAALDLCYVAAGRFDGFWEWNLHPWDTAAGWLIVEEAGGCVTDFDSTPYDAWAPRILATNGFVHAEASALLSAVAAKADPASVPTGAFL